MSPQLPHTTIRRSPLVFIRNLILSELASAGIFFAAKPLAYYRDLYENYLHEQFVPLEYAVVTVVAVTVFELILTLYLFARWYAEAYELSPGRVIHRRGVVRRAQTETVLHDVHSVSVTQGFLGRMGKLGSVHLHLAGSRATLELADVPRPHDVAELVMLAKEGKRRGPGEVSALPELSLNELLAGREHERVEFKSTLRWDRKTSRVNRDLERAALKTVAAFLNTAGGYVVLGIADDGGTVGIGFDCETLQRKDTDGFENHFTQLFRAMIGPEFRHRVRVTFTRRGESDVCMVRVEPADKPAYLTVDGKEEFYIRTGNTTTSLTFREAHAYVASRFSPAP